VEDDVAQVRRLTFVAVVVWLAVSALTGTADAGGGRGGPHASSNDAHNYMQVQQEQQNSGHAHDVDETNSPVAETPQVTTHIDPVCEDHGGRSYNDGSSCSFIVRCTAADGTQGYLVQELTDTDPPELLATYCVTEQEIQNIQPTVTPGLVLEAFGQIPLPKSELVIQPPKGKAPVNFNVIYSTIAEDQDQSIELMGQTVFLKIWPSAYTWHTGDGSEDIVTDWPGRVFDRALPDPENYVWHRYLDAGVVQAAVDVTFSAEFSVGDRSHWQPVDGTVTVEGDPNQLTITPYNPVLSGH